MIPWRLRGYEMGYITKLLLPPKAFDAYVCTGERGNQLAELCPTSTVNIFVGANNSGKSRFMRLLAGQLDFSFGGGREPHGINTALFNREIKATIAEIRDLM